MNAFQLCIVREYSSILLIFRNFAIVLEDLGGPSILPQLCLYVLGSHI